MRKQVYTASRIDCMVCPSCGLGELRHGEEGVSLCERCDLTWGETVTEALRQIASLPDAAGSHPCECGHPEMRHLPDGVFHCPSCGTEVLPIATDSKAEAGSDAYRSGWAYGLFGKAESFTSNDELERWEDPLDRLHFYQGCRAGREALRSECVSPAG
jgi:ribosomal protein L37AE/L43A